MSIVSYRQFLAYTIARLVIGIIVLTTAINSDSNMNNLYSPNLMTIEEKEIANIRNCQALCKHCGCLGFYCGEECLCECNNHHSDTECIVIMQTNAQKMNIPFEILIQGPTANKFVRNALQFEQDIERKANSYRYKRSTITIYMPRKGQNSNHFNQNRNGTTRNKGIINEIKANTERIRRSTKNTFDWLSDLTDNLLRPAPLGIRKSKSSESKPQCNIPKRSIASAVFDNSWFFDDTSNILTPAPLLKRKIFKSLSNLHKDDGTDTSTETNKSSQSHHNLYTEETIHQLRANELEDISDTLELGKTKSTNLIEMQKSSTEDKQISLPENGNLENSQVNLSGGLYSLLFKDNTRKSTNLLETKMTKSLSEFSIPWLRPVKFLQKLKML